MRSLFKRSILSLSVAAALTTAGVAQATNGYFAHGYGTKSKGLAGAGVALPQDAMAAATNPAGMVFVGHRIDVGAAIFNPNREYTAEGTPSAPFGVVPGTQTSDSEYFLIPHLGYNYMLNPNMAVGVSVYGNGGMNTDYEAPGPFNGGQTGVDLSQLFITPTFSMKFAGGKASWGASVIAAYQRFEATGLSPFAGLSTDSSNLTNNGTDSSTGGGFKLGILGEVVSGLKLAASYQSKISMGEFDKYAGLFAEKGGFDIPSTYTVGLAWDTSSNSTLTVDVQQIRYSEIAAIANPISNIQNCFVSPPSGCLGASNGAGFGWDDMTILKIGYQFSTSPMWTWRLGYSHGSQPIPDSEVMFNILAPAVIEDHFTFGFTSNISSASEINFSAMYAANNSVKGQISPSQTVEIEMNQFELEASYAYKF